MFLVTVHDPICTEDGDVNAALYGSFLPIPTNDVFPVISAAEYSHENAPGAIVVKPDRILINRGRERVKLRVTNNGDRPIQVGSHYHFIETNSALSFDRGRAYGKRLDIAAGTAVRFEPGDTKTVTLCAIAGAKIITGGNRLATGVVDLSRTDEIVKNLVQRGFGHFGEPGAIEVSQDTDIGRDAYVAMFGPTTGDRVRLGDTALWIEVERDEVGGKWLAPMFHHPNIIMCNHRLSTVTKSSLAVVSECTTKPLGVLIESLGKTIREGMGQATGRPAAETLDLVITNALIVDWSGIYKVSRISDMLYAL